MQNSLADEPLPFHHPPPPSPLVEQKSAVAVAYARAGKGLVKLNGEETGAFGIGAAAPQMRSPSLDPLADQQCEQEIARRG